MMRLTILCVLCLLLSGLAEALPGNPQTVNGQVRVTQPQTNILQVLQSSPKAILNWNSFNIDPGEIVRFLQPNAQAVLLNRVIGSDPSVIMGKLTSNGSIFLLNPNGILFGQGSVVNTGSFLASTLNLSDSDFLRGKYSFAQQPEAALRAIVNQGTIQVNSAGYVVLVSPLIHNQETGVILAKQGQIVLGATRQATLNIDSQGLLHLAVPDGFGGTTKGADGTVVLTQGQMSNALSQVVNSKGVVAAGSLDLAEGEGILLNQGRISADGEAGGRAGSITFNSSQATNLAAGGVITANGVNSRGGTIRALSAGTTTNAGDIEVQGTGKGDGGFVELSGSGVNLQKAVNLSSANGRPGTLLLDPTDIDIVNGSSASNTSTAVSNGALATQNGNVILDATNNITVDANVNVTFNNAVNVSLTAGNNIYMDTNSSIAAPASSSITFTANNGDITLRTVEVPTITASAPNGYIVTAMGSNNILGVAGQPTNVAMTAGANAAVLLQGNTTVQGSDVNLTATGGAVQVGSGADDHAQFLVNSSTSTNVSMTGTATGASGFSAFDLGSKVGFHSSGPTNVNISTNEDFTFGQNVNTTAGGSSVNFTVAAPNFGNIYFNANATLSTGTSPTTLLLAANQTFDMEQGSLISSTGPTAATITGGNLIIMTPNQAGFASSAFNFTDPSSTLTMTAGQQIGYANLQVPTINLAVTGPGSSPTFPPGIFSSDAANTSLGQPGLPTSVNMSAPGGQVIFQGNTTISGSIANLTIAGNDIEVFPQANLALNATNSATLNVTSTGYFFPLDNSQITSNSPTTAFINANFISMGPNSAFNFTSPSSSLTMTSTGITDIQSLMVANVSVTAMSGYVDTTGGAGSNTILGQPGLNNTINITGPQVYFNGNTTIVGHATNVTVTGNGDGGFVFEEPDANMSVTASNSNLTFSATGNSGSVQFGNLSIAGNNANVTMTSSGVNGYVAENQSGNFQLTAGNSNFNLATTGSNASVVVGNLTVAGNNANVTYTASNDLNGSAFTMTNSSQQYSAGNLNLSASGNFVSFGVNSTARFADANTTHVNMTATTNLFTGPDATLSFLTGIATVDLHADNILSFQGPTSGTIPTISSSVPIVMNLSGASVAEARQAGSLHGADINLTNAASTLNIISAGKVQLEDVHVPNLNIQAGFLDTTVTTIGQANLPTTVNIISTNGMIVAGTTTPGNLVGNGGNFSSPTDLFGLKIQGASVNVSVVSASNGIEFGSGANLTVTGPGKVQFSSNNITFDGNNTVASTSPVNLTLSADNNVDMGVTKTQLSGGSVLNVTAQNATLGPTNAPTVLVTASNGNITLNGQLAGQNVSLNTSGDLIGQQLNATGPVTAAAAGTTLNVTQNLAVNAAGIFGNITDTSMNVSNGLSLATSPTTQVSLNVTGANDTNFGNQAGSIYYLTPQSPSVQLQRSTGAGEVNLIYQRVDSPGVAPVNTGFTPAQIHELQQQTAQGNLAIGNYLPPLSSVLDNNDGLTLISHRSPSLLAYPYSSLGSLTVELISLGSPEPDLLEVDDQDETVHAAQSATADLIVLQGDEEETFALRYWRKLLKHIIIWEDN